MGADAEDDGMFLAMGFRDGLDDASEGSDRQDVRQHSENCEKDPPWRQGLAKSDTFTLLCRFVSG